MENILTTYLNKRLNELEFLKIAKQDQGPVITISREVGCEGLILANKISQRLNRRNLINQWRVVSKDIFRESARELDLEPEKVRQILKKTDKYTFDEILEAFSNRNYKSERIITKSVIKIIRNFAIAGYCIIVGRAGHVIAKDINNAFHIRLFAPIDYRVQAIMKNNKLQQNDALNFIQKIDKERIAFRKAIQNETEDNDFFDLHINRASFGEEETIDIIEHAIEKKQILKNEFYKVQYY